MMDDLWRRDDVTPEDQVRAVRTEYADEEAEAAEMEAAESAAALDVPLSLRVTKQLAQLKQRAAAEQVSPSALVRRILRQTLHTGSEPALTVAQVEDIARRVMRETA